MQSRSNHGQNVRWQLTFNIYGKSIAKLFALVSAFSLFAALSIQAQDTYTAQQDGQWVQFLDEELNLMSPRILELFANDFPDYLVSFNSGTWSETIGDVSGVGFAFPGVGANRRDVVQVGSYNIQLGVKSLEEALDANDLYLDLPTAYHIGTLTVDEGGCLTIHDGSRLCVLDSVNNEGSVLNEGLLLLFGENSPGILRSTGSFVNHGELVISNGTADFGDGDGYSGSGSIILDGNTVLDGKMQLDHGSEITVSGYHNLVKAHDMTVGSDEEGQGQLTLTGNGEGAEVQLTGALKFDENAVTRELVLRQMRAEVDTASYANIDRTVLQSGATLGGNGYENTSFDFSDQSFHDVRGVGSPQVFQADKINYGDGSTVYVNIGSGDYDKIMANAIRFADNDNEQVNVVLFNLGNHNARVIAEDIFSIRETISSEGDDELSESHETTGIQLGGDEIASASVNVDAFSNHAELVAENGSKIRFDSGKYGGNDVVTINDILVGTSSQSLGVDVTGMRYEPDTQTTDPGNDPLPVSANTHRIANAILDNMWGTQLYSAISANAGNDLDTFMGIAASLDPAIASVESATVQSSTMQFNRLIGNRLLASQASMVGGGFASQSQSNDVYRAQKRRTGFVNPSQEYRRMHSAFNSGLWLEGLGAYTNRDDKDGMLGFNGETYGFGVGYDRRISRNFLLGMAFGGTYSTKKVRHDMETSKSDNYIGSLYGCFDSGPWSLSLSGGYASANIRSHRVVQSIGTADGKRNGNTWFASTELAYRLDGRKCYLTPFYRFDFVGYHEDDYTETGQNINMAISSRNDTGLLQTVGFRIGTQFTNAVDWKIIPEVTAGWIHDYGDGEVTTTAQFVQGGPAFVLNGLSRVKERALVGLGLNVVVTPQFNVFARYDGELASCFCSHTGQVGMYLYF